MISGPAKPAIVTGAVGAVLMTLGGFGAGATPHGKGPAHLAGLPALTYGHGAILMLAVTWLGISLVVSAWVALAPLAIRGRLTTRDALIAAAAWSLPLLPSVPLFSRDAWSYLAQGSMANAGYDPFSVGPAVNPGPMTDQIADDWQITPTPYGPGHLLLMRAIAFVAGDRPEMGILTLRILLLAALAGLAWALLVLSRRTGTDPGLALWATVASPLTVLHLTGGLHNEVFALLPAVVAVVLALQGRAVAAAALIGLAMAIKITALLVAPFLLWLLLDSRRRAGLAVGAGVVIRLLGTLAGGGLAVAAAISAIGGGLGWLRALDVSDRIINYLSMPTALAHLVSALTDDATFNEILDATRSGATVTLMVILVVVWWLHRRDRAAAFRGIVIALIAFVLLNTVSWPWYYPWIAAFWAAARPTRAATTAAVGATVFLSLVLGPDGSTSLYTAPIMAAASVATILAVLYVARRLRADSVRTRSPAPVA